MSARKIGLWLFVLLASVFASSPSPAAAPLPVLSGNDAKVFDVLQSLNQIPQEQLNEKAAPAVALIQALNALDGPDFLTLKRLMARATIRASINPTVKAIVAGYLSNRWDGFTLAGNLWLAALRSPNPDFRNKARLRVVEFIQPAHIPVLISWLKIPGPNVLSFEILQEVTGQRLDPSVKAWSAWWKKSRAHVDIVGHLINDTRRTLDQDPLHPFLQTRLWYAPDKIEDASVLMSKRSAAQQEAIGEWKEWVNGDVKRYVDDFSESKPSLDRIVHQPDARVTRLLEKWVADPGYGDYASVLLAWRKDPAAIPPIQRAYGQFSTAGRALARGSLGDKTALTDLLKIIADHPSPLTYGLMDDPTRSYVDFLRTVAIIPAEQAFELLTHESFGLRSAATRRDKKKALRKAQKWLHANLDALRFDAPHGYFTQPAALK